MCTGQDTHQAAPFLEAVLIFSRSCIFWDTVFCDVFLDRNEENTGVIFSRTNTFTVAVKSSYNSVSKTALSLPSPSHVPVYLLSTCQPLSHDKYHQTEVKQLILFSIFWLGNWSPDRDKGQPKQPIYNAVSGNKIIHHTGEWFGAVLLWDSFIFYILRPNLNQSCNHKSGVQLNVFPKIWWGCTFIKAQC